VLTYMITMTTHYVEDVGVDGFRCDYSQGVPLEFWQQWRAAMKELNPDIFLLSENDNDYLLKAFDATYDQETYREMLSAFLQGNPNLLLKIPMAEKRKSNPDVLRARFLENHDQRRAAYPTQLAPPEALETLNVYLLTTDDLPFIQNGQEVGITQTLSLFEPDKIKWDAGRPELREVFKKVLGIRNANPALRRGDITDAQSSEKSVAAFVRTTPEQQVLVLISFAREPVSVKLGSEVASRKGKDLVDGSDVDVANGFEMSPWSWRIIELK